MIRTKSNNHGNNCVNRPQSRQKMFITDRHPFNGLFSRTTWVSWTREVKPFWILIKQDLVGWQWHQLDHMQIICTSLQTDNHASTSSLKMFYRLDALPYA